MTTAESLVLVTGGSGYVGTHVIAALLRDGRQVRTTVRSMAREAGVRAAVRRDGADDTALTVVEADLRSDDGWAAAAAGCAEVHHVASPIPVVQPDNPDDLIVPARDGTLRVLRAAHRAGVRRVVLTSSFAAIGYSPKPAASSPGAVASSPGTVAEFTEDDWTDPDTPGLAAYPRSKAVAERAAWDFARDSGLDLVSVNPTAIFGPALTTDLGSSMYLIKALREGTVDGLPDRRFGIADVRDVADLHLRAMAAPDAGGRRFICVSDGPTWSFAEVADVLRGKPVSRTPVDGPIIHNGRAKTLGWRPRPAETTIVESVTENSARSH
ncbi:NAD-dependent epimerase/dehydratase family protein [Actinoplanes sp. NPDC089786]|uniref:NAD-dependent epimerase/dehydratase family protein n=1 Tax=Actinoplanes sp. NPDC089786 TaxID=3155185 RepID=UPI00343017C1